MAHGLMTSAFGLLPIGSDRGDRTYEGRFGVTHTYTYVRTAVHAEDCSQRSDPEPCERCGHFACWHRLDDSTNVSPTDPAAKFRCLGEGFDGCEDRCPDYMGQVGATAHMKGES